jgi:putative intracellular protease/amidase
MTTTMTTRFERRRALALGAAAALCGLLSACAPAEVKAPPQAEGPPAAKGKVLVLVSSENKIPLKEGTAHATGYFLNELMVPTKALLDAGYTPVMANPRGTKPVMDEGSDSPTYFDNDPKALEDIKRLRDSLPTYQAPRAIGDVLREGLDGYAAVFVPGGHAPMGDLVKEPEVGRVLRHFHEKQKITALICHGPIALLAAAQDPAALVEALASGDTAAQKKLSEGWPYAGYRLTVFSTPEEQTAEQSFLKGHVRFYPDQALRNAGASVDVAAPWQSHVVRDRELITGQQPNSDVAFSKQLVEALRETAPAAAAPAR